ncbi:magnesium chelatase subunit H [Rhodopseudomonas palustris]|uniref:magnesium chelatase n=1 Tax=Thiospirillum jenense TaxID=1653858 RepID=A0A839H388_9GAMM|nr:magnesium chelatase subunit H [Thiospirillum jenense]MBB1089741.1 magnesium chelatase subunit H [Rhodopseudomonas palustris]MBB1124843.1 magnesium chelatase subunit H [Thiospirillum jenense]
MPKPTSTKSTKNKLTPVRVVIVTLDNHLAGAAERAQSVLQPEIPGVEVKLHAATDWESHPESLAQCHADIAQGDIVVATMLFLDEHVKAVLPALEARRDHCDAMVGCMSAAEVMRLTRLGKFDMSAPQTGAMALLKRLRGGSKQQGEGQEKSPATSGAGQMAMLRRIPKILRFIPGTAQDVRSYFLTLQYWLAGSDENVVNMVRQLIDRYAAGPRATWRGLLKVTAPAEYPEVGLFHPRLKIRITDRLNKLPAKLPKNAAPRGTVGLLLMRSYVLAGNTAHYDGVIAALEARGLRVIPTFASGLDARPAIEKFFFDKGKTTVDAVVSLTGFSLVGGPAYNDATAAQELLAKLDVPYLAAHPVEFQTLEQWQASDRGLMPVEATMMVAIPELDGSTGPMVFGGRSAQASADRSRDMQSHEERAEMLAARVDRLIRLRQTPAKERRIAAVLFNFPPNAGNTGTAAYLAVFESLYRTLLALKHDGYHVDLPADVDELRERVIHGTAARYGAHANVFTRIPADDHVTREKYLADIEAQWGPAPGKHQSDGSTLFILGEQFGNVFVGVQPSFGYEGDPMRLLFDKGFAPTHAFSAFYRFLRDDFGAHAVLHFGTHGALEFMPGKQAGLSSDCWPDRLIGDLPNLYLYASNNPSEGTIAKRRAAATLISYLTPPIANAGLYRGLVDLKGSIERWRTLTPETLDSERIELAELIQAQAVELDLVPAEPAWTEHDAERHIQQLNDHILEVEYTLIPYGLHVVGEPPNAQERIDLLLAVAEATGQNPNERAGITALVEGVTPERALAAAGIAVNAEAVKRYADLAHYNQLLSEDHETPAILRALAGRFVRPAPGGDLLRTPEILPTGRNLHGFDPFRIPSTFAMREGIRHAQLLLDRYLQDGNPLPESIALVLWGTDNLKTEGGPIAQALALLGARPRLDSYGRVCGAQLISLEELGRPRIDVVMTLSGIFRDLLPLQTKLLAEASFFAATADEPVEQNYVRKHALAYQQTHGCDLETAALRVFSNADGAYGSNVNHLIDNSRWDEEDELAETYTQRKCFAYGRAGTPVRQSELLKTILGDVQLAYQNLDSVELGVTTVDHYFDTLGGISRAVSRSRGGEVPVYIGDQTRGDGTVRTLSEQVALETRTRMLNPKWYEGMLKHGYEGVRQIEVHVTNTMGWSATTGQVAPWVYQRMTETFVLDEEMRERLAALNPAASAKVTRRLLEAHERNYWQPDAATLEALRRADEELEDRLEGITEGVAVA